MITGALHGAFVAAAAVLVLFGAAKLVTPRRKKRQSSARSLRARVLTIHENSPRLVGTLEVVSGTTALVFSHSLWAAALVTALGVVFAGVLIARLRVMPDSGCGCLRSADEDSYLSLSTVCRATTIGLGGVCGLVSGNSVAAGGYAVGGAVLLVVLVAVLSPELWRYMNVRCGRPLVFAAQDDRRRLARSPGYQRLRDSGLIGKRPVDVWAEGCVRYFAFAVEERDASQIATFQVGPAGVHGRVVQRAVPAGADTSTRIVQKT